MPDLFKGLFVLKEAKDPEILNPYYLRCNHIPFRKKAFKSIYIFWLHKNIPASIILEVFSLFLLSKLNTKQIYNKLLIHVKNCISYNIVCAILDNIRNCKANFLKYQYRLKQIGGAPEKQKNYSRR